jgi:hypothetical protein
MTWVLQKSKNLIWYTSRFFIGFCHKYAKHQAEISSVFAGHIIESNVHGGILENKTPPWVIYL